MKMIKEFQTRAKRRKLVAYSLLTLSILIVLCSIILIILQLQDLQDHHVTDVLNIVSRLSFIALVTYISQLLQRLYRYNILKADYFLSCADALKLSTELSTEHHERFIKMFSSLNGVNVTLNETDAPVIPFITQKKEKDEKEE